MGIGVLVAAAVLIINGVHAKPLIVIVIINQAGVGGTIVIAGESIFPTAYTGMIGSWGIAPPSHQ